MDVLKNQIMGCIKYSDREDVKRTIENVTGITVLKLREEKTFFIVEYLTSKNDDIINNFGLKLIKKESLLKF